MVCSPECPRSVSCCGACRWGRELFVEGKAQHSHVDALQRSQAWIPIRASIPASDCYTLPGSSLVWREILASLAGFCRMPRHTPRCSNHQALLLGDTQLVQHFLRANSFEPVQESLRGTQGSAFHLPSCPETGSSPYRNDVF